jgi:hypothetical protein
MTQPNLDAPYEAAARHDMKVSRAVEHKVDDYLHDLAAGGDKHRSEWCRNIVEQEAMNEPTVLAKIIQAIAADLALSPAHKSEKPLADIVKGLLIAHLTEQAEREVDDYDIYE